MTGNKLKILACVSMLLDHIGYILFPKIFIFRYIGRLALPLFSYLLAEGCLHTKHKLKYFLSVLVLGIICQSAFFIESLIAGASLNLYFNILFTFSFSLILCYAFLNLKEHIIKKEKNASIQSGLIFILAFLLVLFVTELLPTNVNVYLYFDYGIAGALLPLFALIFKDKRLKLLCFTFGITLFNLLTYKVLSYTWLSYLGIIPLFFYNGKRGKKGLKYFFYAFYPLHLAIIYLIQLLI